MHSPSERTATAWTPPVMWRALKYAAEKSPMQCLPVPSCEGRHGWRELTVRGHALWTACCLGVAERTRRMKHWRSRYADRACYRLRALALNILPVCTWLPARLRTCTSSTPKPAGSGKEAEGTSVLLQLRPSQEAAASTCCNAPSAGNPGHRGQIQRW